MITAINGFNVRPEVGCFVVPDGWHIGAHLQDCDDWDKADFRIHASTVRLDLACKVEVTGRKLHWNRFGQHSAAVRVKITFVGDCEPDVVVHGFMWV